MLWPHAAEPCDTHNPQNANANKEKAKKNAKEMQFLKQPLEAGSKNMAISTVCKAAPIS